MGPKRRSNWLVRVEMSWLFYVRNCWSFVGQVVCRDLLDVVQDAELLVAILWLTTRHSQPRGLPADIQLFLSDLGDDAVTSGHRSVYLPPYQSDDGIETKSIKWSRMNQKAYSWSKDRLQPGRLIKRSRSWTVHTYDLVISRSFARVHHEQRHQDTLGRWIRGRLGDRKHPSARLHRDSRSYTDLSLSVHIINLSTLCRPTFPTLRRRNPNVGPPRNSLPTCVRLLPPSSHGLRNPLHLDYGNLSLL